MKANKYIILFFLIISIEVLKAQPIKSTKIDTLYYLLDTAKTQINDRLWDIHDEYPSVKIYVIKCSCLPFNNQPTFVENTGITTSDISKKKILALKLVTLETLISKAKQVADDDKIKDNYCFFFIEPVKNKFVLHHVRLLNLTKPREPSKDYIIIPGK